MAAMLKMPFGHNLTGARIVQSKQTGNQSPPTRGKQAEHLTQRMQAVLNNSQSTKPQMDQAQKVIRGVTGLMQAKRTR
jgi:hypothetical protein